MKKSKIIWLSLGFAGLAAIAVTTPLVLTSCSNSISIITPILSTFAQGMFALDLKTFDGMTVANFTGIPTNNFTDKINGITNNAVTIYTGVTPVITTENGTSTTKNEDNKFGSLLLSSNISEIIGSQTIQDNDINTSVAEITWISESKSWKISTDNVLQKKPLPNASTVEFLDGEVVSIRGEIKETDKPTKTISIRIKFILGNNPSTPSTSK